MKKVGIRLLLSLILVTTVVVAATVPVSAAKPVRLGITITCITEGSITVHYWWDKIGAHYYQIFVEEFGGSGSLNGTPPVYLGGRTPSQSGYLTLTSANITCGHTYRAWIRLYRNHVKGIRGAGVWSPQAYFDCPPPSIFAEDFCGVPNGALPEGWVTDNSSLVYVVNHAFALGASPELCIDFGWDMYTTYNYSACTPTIDATSTNTTLNLTFKHCLDIFGWDESFTYSVEVSNNAGSNWTAVLEETPTEAQYPGMIIGPKTENIDLSEYVGDNILIRWRLRGYTYYSDGWFIDDITVIGS